MNNNSTFIRDTFFRTVQNLATINQNPKPFNFVCTNMIFNNYFAILDLYFTNSSPSRFNYTLCMHSTTSNSLSSSLTHCIVYPPSTAHQLYNDRPGLNGQYSHHFTRAPRRSSHSPAAASRRSRHTALDSSKHTRARAHEFRREP